VYNGYQRGKKDYPETLNWKIFDNKGNSKLSRFSLYVEKERELNKDISFQRLRNLSHYTLPKVLMSQSFDGKLIKSVINEEQILFPLNFYAVAKENKLFLEITQASLSSNTFGYWLVAISSYYGIERPIFLLDDVKHFPIDTSYSSKKLLTTFKNLKSLFNLAKYPIIEGQYHNLYLQLNHEIYKAYKFSKQEIAIIEYANEVTIPSIHYKKKYEYLAPIKLNEKGKSYLKSYAQIIRNHFNHLFRKAGKKIQVNIYHSKHTIGVEFCVVDKANTKSNINFIANKDSKQTLTKFALLSYEKLSEDLFIQKDIKGFEEESFYVIKPNEYKCWHRAIGHLDLGEILEATLKAGAKQKRAKQYAQ